jgi:aryl-alcohol dehydrogenase
MKTRAAVAHRTGGPFVVEEVELDDPRAGEVLVRVLASGICQTDLHGRDAYYAIKPPAVYGHEGVGVVERAGAGVTNVREGDRVVMFAPSCGACVNCTSRRPAYCLTHWALKSTGTRADGSPTLWQHGRALGGAFFQQSSLARHALATARNVVRVADDVPAHVLAALPCGVNTGAGAAVNVLGVRPGMSVAIVGAGAVGLAALLAAHEAGCAPIIAVDIRANRLALARSLGATHVVDANAQDFGAALRSATGGRGVDGLVDTTGVPETVEAGVHALAMPGTYVVLGSARPGSQGTFDHMLLQNGRAIVGCIQGGGEPAAFIPYLVERYRAGGFPVDRLVTTYRFEDVERAAQDLASGAAVKPVVLMD